MNTSTRSNRWMAACVVGILLAASPALGQTIQLGGGWQATVPNLSTVGINVDLVAEDYIAIEISKDFTEPSVNGIFPGISIFFSVVPGGPAVPNIVILDESVTNLTGESWTDYHMELLGGGAEFNIGASLGFGMSPFASVLLGLTTLDAFNGVVANNSSFFPGAGAGELVINAPGDFELRQTPTPEPTTLGLLAAGLGALAIRRRLAR